MTKKLTVILLRCGGAFVSAVIVFFAVSLQASAASLDNAHLRIVWRATASTKPDDEKAVTEQRADWLKGCQTLGERLLVGKGPYGFGVFKDYSCFIDDSLVSGTKEKSPWELDLTLRRNTAAFVIKFSAGGSKPRTTSRVALPRSDWTLLFLSEGDFADLVAFALLDGMPMLTKVSAATLHGGSGVIPLLPDARKEPRRWPLPPPPQALALYELKFEGGLWRGNLVATARRSDDGDKNQKGWKLDRRVDESHALWAHDASGRATRLSKLTEQLQSAQGEMNEAKTKGHLTDYITDALIGKQAAGYVGVRYGAQILPGSALLSKTRLIGILVELRSGVFSGLRAYVDIIPKASETTDGEKNDLSYRRIIVGKSWSLNLPAIVDRIDITPKIGQWTFSADIPVDIGDGSTPVRPFSIDHKLSLALEVGAEWDSDFYTVRVWYAQDAALSLFGKLDASSVTSERVGLDTYWTGGPTLKVFGVPFKSTLIAFGVLENVDLKGGTSSPSEAIAKVNFIDAYLGAGLAVSW